ncbi:MAG TPA: hypothetical protein GX708_05325 [Gallicola sp.]|nr:hypothetical protein [Gallicola sp.]
MKNELALLTSKKAGFLKRDVCILSFFNDQILVTTLDNKKNYYLLKRMKKKKKEESSSNKHLQCKQLLQIIII